MDANARHALVWATALGGRAHGLKD